MPSFVDPKPVVRVAADERFQDLVEALGVESDIAFEIPGSDEGDGWIEMEHVRARPLIPDEEAGDDGGFRAQRQTCKKRGRARRTSEEVAEEAFVWLCVQVHEDADRLPLAQRYEDAPRGIALGDEVIAAQRAVGLDQAIKERVVQGANQKGHSIAIERVSEGAQFPRAEVSREDEHAAPLRPRALVMFQSLVGDDRANRLARQLGELAEFAQQPSQVPKRALEEAASLARAQFRKDEGEVAVTNPPQSAPGIVDEKSKPLPGDESPGSWKTS